MSFKITNKGKVIKSLLPMIEKRTLNKWKRKKETTCNLLLIGIKDKKLYIDKNPSL